MSLLPTTRINTLVSTSSNSGADTGLAGQDEDILLVDFQPVVVPTNQILSSPSTTSTAMYPLPPPASQMPGAHMMGLNHQPSLSSDGITTPISATGSSGKVHSNPNNYSLVNLSNHAHHNNNTSREESDLNYPAPIPHHLQFPPSTLANANAVMTQANNLPYDEDDEFARHQALAQPSLMLNKRRSRRFANRDSHIWDNANHVGHGHHPHSNPQGQQRMSSSLSSSEDSSDTGFLMGTRKTAYTRRSVQKVIDPLPASNNVGGGNMSPSATTGLLPHAGNRKRVRRRRQSARNRKPVNNERDKINPSDVLSFCCCLCEDDRSSGNHRLSHTSSLRNRYFRLIFVLIAIIVIAVLVSITVSLQRKVDSLDLSLKKLDQAVGSPLAVDTSSGESNNNVHKAKDRLEALLASHNELNSTVVTFKSQLDQTLSKLQDLQKQLNSAITKQDGVTELRTDLAKLGSRVEELSATIEKIKKGNAIEKENNNNNNNNNNDKESKSTSDKEGKPLMDGGGSSS